MGTFPLTASLTNRGYTFPSLDINLFSAFTHVYLVPSSNSNPDIKYEELSLRPFTLPEILIT